MSLPKTIHVLSEQTINQIAAGEVIENPASVVKELFENAIDAGALHIHIEILGGGFQSIKVGDDGSGMTPEDAMLCIARHATSKIVSAEDLFQLETMGFRGEALASIAAISKMTLLTATEHTPCVTLEVEGGKIVSVNAGARRRGTTIEVRSLFYNVPARKQFQKSMAASRAEITKVVTQLSLAHPEVGVTLIQQQETILELLPSMAASRLQALQERAAMVLGKTVLDAMVPLECKEEHVTLWGVIGTPQLSRPNRSLQSLVMNRRPVWCPSIAYTVKEAYGTFLAEERHPVFILHVAVDPRSIDVNVHPQKKEVRLKEESVLKYHLQKAVSAALTNTGTAPSHRSVESLGTWIAPSAPMWHNSGMCQERVEAPVEPEISLELPWRVLGLFSHYLLLDGLSVFPEKKSPGILFFDLTAIEAALWFATITQHSNPIAYQRLLFPVTLTFSKGESECIVRELSLLESVGLAMCPISQTAFLLEEIPSFLEEGALTETVHALLLDLQELERKGFSREEKKVRLATSIASQIRYRFKSYHVEEAIALAKALLRLKPPWLSPQGKPIMYYMEEDAIRRGFFSTSST